MIRLLYVILLISLFGCSQSETVHSEYMSLEDVKYVDAPLQLIHLQDNGADIPKLQDIPIKNFCFYDSLMMVSTYRDKGLLEILSINELKSYGSLINKGKANGEFVYGINITLQTTFSSKKDSIYAHSYDPVTGRLYKINITDKTDNNIINIEEETIFNKMPHSAFWAKMISDTCCILRSIDNMETRQLRSIITPNTKQTKNKAIELLNDFEIPMNEDFNIMSSLVALSPQRDMIVEAPLGMNYINIYSPITGDGFTLCTENKMDKLSHIISTSKYDRKYMFADLRAYNFGFAILKYDIKENIYQSAGKYSPTILLFDWKGTPLGEIKPPTKYSHFDFDLKNGYLYILNTDGHLKKYKCDFLKALYNIK